ncbi:hypothetical protein HZB88_00435 [archaeon]|nr:hypothetical protein [archaeon]
MKKELLMDLGLSNNEAEIFLALLQQGPMTAGQIADICKLHRGGVYDTLVRLTEKGVVGYIFKDRKKIFEAINPSQLINILQEKEKKFYEVLPQLLLDYKLAKEPRAYVEIFEGLKAFRIVLYDLLKYKKPIQVFGIPKSAPETIRSFINHFHNKRIELKIPMTHIYNEDARERIKYLNTLPYTEAYYLPEEFNTGVSTLVCGPEVFIIAWTKSLILIRIHNQALADSYKKYFNLPLSHSEKLMKPT